MAENKVHELFIAHYQDSKDQVFTYLMYRLNFNRDICEDLLMDIVLKSYEKFHQFDPNKGSFKNWIFRIAHNHLVNHWRDAKESLPLESAEHVASKVEPVKMEGSSIEKVLNLLSDTEREMITLRYLNGLSYEEMARVVGKNQGTVRTSVSRALSQFKIFYSKLYE